MDHNHSWRILFTRDNQKQSIMIDSSDRRQAREDFLLEHPDVQPSDILRVVLVPD
jgi:hypothetical protein